MQYQILIDNQTVLGGDVFIFGIAIAITLLVAVLIGSAIWRKLKENDVMKYEFITIIAHKFRTPLTSMKWAIEDLMNSNIESRAKEEVQQVGESTDNLINLTGTLIELTEAAGDSKAMYKFERVSISEFAKKIGELYKKAFHEKNIVYNISCQDNDIFAKIDQARMEFVLETLLENSYMYTPVGRHAEMNVTAGRNKVMISVSDGGIGISEHDRQHITEKFYRGENAKNADPEGVGVGLYLAKTIVKRHKGKLEVSSPGVDSGSTFSIILPRA